MRKLVLLAGILVGIAAGLAVFLIVKDRSGRSGVEQVVPGECPDGPPAAPDGGRRAAGAAATR